MSEHDEQVALFEWAKLMEAKHPDLALLFAIPNGGHRHKAVATKLKREGVKPGVPDICLPVARGGWHGLYIEMKFGRNKTTEAQAWWLSRLHENGYWAHVCLSAERAIQVIEHYLALG